MSDRRALSGSRTGVLLRTHIGRIAPSVIDASRNLVARHNFCRTMIVEDIAPSRRLTNRRSFLVKGAAVAVGAIGAGRLLAHPSPASADGGLTKGDVAILRFLAAAELLEA